MGTVRAVPCLCELYRGHCLTAKGEARKQPVRVVEKCQVDMIQRVETAALREYPGQCVDPDLPALGDPRQRSVSVDICRAA